MATDSHRPNVTRVGAVDSLGPSSESDVVRIARIESYEDAPDECTIYPANAPANVLTTTWISAREGSFVRLDAMR